MSARRQKLRTPRNFVQAAYFQATLVSADLSRTTISEKSAIVENSLSSSRQQRQPVLAHVLVLSHYQHLVKKSIYHRAQFSNRLQRFLIPRRFLCALARRPPLRETLCSSLSAVSRNRSGIARRSRLQASARPAFYNILRMRLKATASGAKFLVCRMAFKAATRCTASTKFVRTPRRMPRSLRHRRSLPVRAGRTARAPE